MKIEYKDIAIRDIKETKEYIENNLKNKQAAQKLVTALLKSISLLSDNPLMGMPLSSKFDVESSVRFLVVAKQIVFYEIFGDVVSILRVIDGRRDYMAVLFG